MRINRNFSWFSKTGVRDDEITFDEFYNNRKAPIYHHFNTHQWCFSKWCWARRLDEEEDELKRCQPIDAGESEGEDDDDSKVDKTMKLMGDFVDNEDGDEVEAMNGDLF